MGWSVGYEATAKLIVVCAVNLIKGNILITTKITTLNNLEFFIMLGFKDLSKDMKIRIAKGNKYYAHKH